MRTSEPPHEWPGCAPAPLLILPHSNPNRAKSHAEGSSRAWAARIAQKRPIGKTTARSGRTESSRWATAPEAISNRVRLRAPLPILTVQRDRWGECRALSSHCRTRWPGHCDGIGSEPNVGGGPDLHAGSGRSGGRTPGRDVELVHVNAGGAGTATRQHVRTE